MTHSPETMEKIRKRAYEIYLQRGGISTKEQQDRDWFLAIGDLKSQEVIEKYEGEVELGCKANQGFLGSRMKMGGE